MVKSSKMNFVFMLILIGILLSPFFVMNEVKSTNTTSNFVAQNAEDDEYEDNDESYYAAYLGPSELTYDLVYLDKDYFIVEVGRKWNCTVTLSCSTTTENLDLFVYSQYGILMGESTGPNSNEEYTIHVSYSSDTNFTVFINCSSSSEILDPIPYQLSISLTHQGVPVPALLIFIPTMIVLGIIRKRKKR